MIDYPSTNLEGTEDVFLWVKPPSLELHWAKTEKLFQHKHSGVYIVPYSPQSFQNVGKKIKGRGKGRGKRDEGREEKEGEAFLSFSSFFPFLFPFPFSPSSSLLPSLLFPSSFFSLPSPFPLPSSFSPFLVLCSSTCTFTGIKFQSQRRKWRIRNIRFLKKSICKWFTSYGHKINAETKFYVL